MFQKKMKEEIKRIGSTEDSIFSDLEVFESKSLLQVSPCPEGVRVPCSRSSHVQPSPSLCSSARCWLRWTTSSPPCRRR